MRRLVLLIAVAATLATASAPEAAEPRLLPKIDLVIVGDVREYTMLQERVLSWFQARAAAVRATRRDGLDADAVLNSGGAPGIRIWIVLRSAMRVRLHFMVQTQSGASQHYLVRDLDLDRGLDELGLEQVSQVVYLSAVALWEGSRVDPRLTATFDVVPSPPQRNARPDVRWSSGLEYGLRLCGPEGTAHGPGLVVGAVLHRPRLEVGARVHLQMLLLRELDAGGLALHIQGLSFRAGPALALHLSHGLSLDGEAGLGLDMMQISASPGADAALTPSGSDVDLRPLAYLQPGVTWSRGDLRLGIFMPLTIQVFRTHYDVVDGAQRLERLVPWIVQPGLVLAVGW